MHNADPMSHELGLKGRRWWDEMPRMGYGDFAV
jgi:hypothetical protein